MGFMGRGAFLRHLPTFRTSVWGTSVVSFDRAFIAPHGSDQIGSGATLQGFGALHVADAGQVLGK